MVSDYTLMLEEAARDGNLELLANLVKENRSILVDFKLASLQESLLHVATKSRELYFARELMRIDPGIARELNKDGFRPLDIAVIAGDFEMVKEILSFDRDLCRRKGKDRRTALHYAAIKGRVDVIDLLLLSSPGAVLEDVTVYGETALHLAVKNYQVDAFFALLKWLEGPAKESVLDMGDCDGNTVLHVAVSTRQYECVDVLIHENIATGRTTISVNAKNANGLTPLDVLHIQDSYDIREKLEHAGAIGAPQRSKKFETRLEPENNLQSEEPSRNWFKYFKFQMQRDSPSETRNALLVVAALIATVCFQAGTNPPKGVLDKQPPPPPPPPPPPNQDSGDRQLMGPVGGSALAALSAIFGSHSTSFLFLFGNSLGLTASTCIIIYLTSGFPFQRELHIALYSTMFTYGFAISTAIEGVRAEQKAMAYVLVSIAFALPFAQRWLPRWAKKARKYWKKRHARESNTTLSIEI